jgi:hypothetical protein
MNTNLSKEFSIVPMAIAVLFAVTAPLALPCGAAAGTLEAIAVSTAAAGVPASVEAVGLHGENLYDMAKANDWPKAKAALASLHQAAQQLRTDLKGGHADERRLDASIAALDKAVAAADRLTAMREANQVTLIGADLAGPFKPPVPVEVTKLDYYGRELEIWAAAKNGTKLQATAAAMRRTWDTLRPMVESRNAAEAKTFDSLMARVTAARSPDQFGQLAAAVLAEVDNLEKVFQK